MSEETIWFCIWCGARLDPGGVEDTRRHLWVEHGIGPQTGDYWALVPPGLAERGQTGG